MATPLMNGTAESRARLRAALDEQVLRALTPVAGATAIIYGASAVSVMFTWPAPTRALMTLLYAFMALVGLGLLWFHHRGRVRARYANATIGALLVAGAGYTALNLLAPRSMEQLVAGLIGPLVAGVLLFHWRWFFVVSIAHVATATAVAVAMDLPSLVSFLVVLAAGVAVGALLHMVRSRNATRIESLLATNEAQRMTLERALHDLHATQEEALRREKLSALGTLVAGVAHEINNPLTYMRGNLELAEQTLMDKRAAGLSLSPDDVEEVLGQHRAVLAGVDRIAHITRSLKQVARSTPGVIADEDVNALCDGVLTVAAARIGADVEIRRDYGKRVVARVNAGDISQVLLNLVLNAADAMENHGRLTIATRHEGERAIVEVTDTGAGVPLSHRSKLFTPFFTTKGHGTGLGLSISHRIVDDHGGDLRYEDAPGGGARFVIELPLSRAPRHLPLIHAQGS